MTHGGWKAPSTIPKEAISAVAFFSAQGSRDIGVTTICPLSRFCPCCHRLGGFRFLLPSGADQPIVCRLLIAGSVSSQCSGKAFRPHFVCREGGDLLGCSGGGLQAGPTAAGVRRRGEGFPAMPDQLCGDGFCGDPAAEASLGPLTRCQNRRTTASTSVLAKGYVG